MSDLSSRLGGSYPWGNRPPVLQRRPCNRLLRFGDGEGRSLDPGDVAAGGASAIAIRRLRRSATAGRLGEAVYLLLAPVLVFFGLHVRAMPRTLMVDPFFYGAYAFDGPDLLRRFGTGNYFWPRVGFILPDRLFVTLFGPLGGFFSFRYVLALLATVPVYMLFRQVWGRWAGALAVLVILTAPVILSAWGTDYPDSSAVSYLTAGAACAFMKAKSPRAQLLWTLAAGVFIALAVNSQAVAGLTSAGILAGRVLSARADGRARIVRDLLVAALGFVSTTGILVIFTAITMGHWDIFRPTAHAILQYRRPSEIALFHSSTWRWLIDDIYVLAPPALVGAWLVAAWPVLGRTDISRAELGFATATAVAYALHVFGQFVAANWTLEYYLYTSMLWAVVCPLLAFTAVRVSRTGREDRSARLSLVLSMAALIGIPLIVRVFRDHLQIGFGIALALVGVPALGALIARWGRLRLVGSTLAVICVSGASTLLVTGLPVHATIYPGQVPYFTPDYGTALFGDGQAAVDDYAIFAGLHTVVPTSDQVPGALAMWWPQRASRTVVVASAQYLWILNALPASLPSLDPPTRASLLRRHPRLLLLLSDSGGEFDAAEAALNAAGFTSRTVRETTIVSGQDALHVRVLELTSHPSE